MSETKPDNKAIQIHTLIFRYHNPSVVITTEIFYRKFIDMENCYRKFIDMQSFSTENFSIFKVFSTKYIDNQVFYRKFIGNQIFYWKFFDNENLPIENNEQNFMTVSDEMKKYFLHILLSCLPCSSNPGFMSNNLTHYLNY